METIKRFAITHLAKDGLRTLAFANQGQHHYDTRELAESALLVMRSSLQYRLGLVALEVREVECYPHGDAVGIYFETNYQPVSGMPPFTATCCVCGKDFVVGQGLDSEGREYSTMYADTTGTPWKAYYCADDSKAARELQAVQKVSEAWEKANVEGEVPGAGDGGYRSTAAALKVKGMLPEGGR